MIYSFSLRSTGLLVGFLLIAAHAAALIHARGIKQWLRELPRSRFLGALLLLAAALWAFALVSQMDLGEFTAYRRIFLAVIVTGAVLTFFFVEEFLAVRALGMLLLLAGEPLLEAAFQRPEASRLLLSILAYAWVALGLFWIGMPYLLRDQIEWVTRTDARWRLAALGGILYGAALFISALFFYGA